MWETAQQLCENISGCKFAYTQSDEITLILTDYEDIKTEPWFGNNLQKIVSISASMATYYFNKAFYQAMEDEYLDWYIDGEESKSLMTHSEAYNERIACFDARAFIVPREEIFNVLYWRQLDCVRNSIQLLGQAHFSHKQLQNKDQNEIQEMLFQEKGINWANEPNWFKNGVALYRKPIGEPTIRNKWYLDLDTPIFTKDRNYIEKHI